MLKEVQVASSCDHREADFVHFNTLHIPEALIIADFTRANNLIMVPFLPN